MNSKFFPTDRTLRVEFRRFWITSLLGVTFSMLVASSAWGVQDVDLHDLNWYVHVDLVTLTQDLAFWQSVIDEAIASANVLVEGGQGPFDTACCSRIGRSASLAVFGSPGDGFDIIDSLAEQNALNLFGGAGSNAYLVDSITFCGVPGAGIAGCGAQPVCNFNGNDNPNLWMAVTVSSFNSGTLPVVMAHERGHNACLVHDSTAACQIMQPAILNPGLGGCFTASECSNFRNGRTMPVSGLQCGCHATAGGIEADGTLCSDFVAGLCSGGLCGDPTGDAAVKLIVSAKPGSAGFPAPENALILSGLSGNWTDQGLISPTAEDFHGLAYASDSDTLYGVVPTPGDDLIMTIDKMTGARIAIVGSIANGTSEIIGMAYHPGATSSPGDDRLVMMEVSGTFGTVIWVDPASPSVRNVYGALNLGSANEFSGLAYDSIHGTLFLSSPFSPGGLYRIDLASCPPSPCIATPAAGATDLFAFDGSLSFSTKSGMLYQLAPAFSGTRSFYDVIDPTTGTSARTLSLDEFTPGGLAAVPEPGWAPGIGAGLVGLIGAGRRRRKNSLM